MALFLSSFQARCRGRLSDPFMNAVIKLHEAVLTKQQFLEYGHSAGDDIEIDAAPCEENGIEP